MDGRTYILRYREETHVGLFVERLEEHLPDGRIRDAYRVVLDDEHYALATSRGAALRRAMTPGVIAKQRTPLTFVGEKKSRRMFAPR